ncbi:MAG: DNA alkylation repair protein [Bacteriovoracia bacterium]
MSYLQARKALHRYANSKKAQELRRFFKTAKGEYAEGDVFIGVMVPQTRVVAKKYKKLAFSDLRKLISSKIHEERLLGLIILVQQFKVSSKDHQKKVYEFYLENMRYINNWDLVDVTCRDIVGAYLDNKPRKLLYKLARSNVLWERRIAIISTFYFIRNGEFSDTIAISEVLLNDREDLLHKAVGWALREVGKKDVKTLKVFLDKHSIVMPRTMLRYAIERLSVRERRYYMNLKNR